MICSQEYVYVRKREGEGEREGERTEGVNKIYFSQKTFRMRDCKSLVCWAKFETKFKN